MRPAELSTYWSPVPPPGGDRWTPIPDPLPPHKPLVARVLAETAARPGRWVCVAGFPTENARRNAAVRLRRAAGRLRDRFDILADGRKLYVRRVRATTRE